MATVDLSLDNIVVKGDLFRGVYATTLAIGTKVLDNSLTSRERYTLYCASSQDGSWVIMDVDEKGQASVVKTVPVTGGKLYIENFDVVAYRVSCTFTPTTAPGTLVIRGYTGDHGTRN